MVKNVHRGIYAPTSLRATSRTNTIMRGEWPAPSRTPELLEGGRIAVSAPDADHNRSVPWWENIADTDKGRDGQTG